MSVFLIKTCAYLQLIGCSLNTISVPLKLNWITFLKPSGIVSNNFLSLPCWTSYPQIIYHQIQKLTGGKNLTMACPLCHDPPPAETPCRPLHYHTNLWSLSYTTTCLQHLQNYLMTEKWFFFFWVGGWGKRAGDHGSRRWLFFFFFLLR